MDRSERIEQNMRTTWRSWNRSDKSGRDKCVGYGSVQYTKEIIDSLKAKSSCGVDGLSVKLLKLIKDEISTSLTLVINQSLLSGIFPDQLTIAKVIPIYKKDDPAIFDSKSRQYTGTKD